MLSRKIADGDTFIVFDLEWNQPLPGKEYPFEVSALSGEIIEIGAVRYVYENGTIHVRGEFSVDIKPVCYTKIHYHVKKVTHKTNADLRNGVPFEEAYKSFREFCGSDSLLAGWGNSDTDMLKMNLKFFGMNDKLDMFFLDIQPLFSMFSTEQGKQRSVEFAVDFYNIPKHEMFHSATSDARYTGEIFKNIFEHNHATEVLSAISSSSIDPDLKREYSEVGASCESPEQALSLVEGFCSCCPVCAGKFEEKISSFRIRKSVYGLYACPGHGEFFGRIRVRKNREGRYYASAVLRFATQTDYFLVASKREEYEKYGTRGAPAPKPEEEAKNE